MKNENILEIYLKSVSRNQLIEKQYIAHKTIKAYKNRLTLFLKHIGDKALSKVTSMDIKDYLADCVIGGIKPTTLKARLSAIKAMFKELSDPDHNLEINNVAEKIKSIRSKCSHKKPIQKDDLSLISEFLNSRKNKSDMDMRNHLFFAILRLYGLRISSALGIEAKDVHFEDNGIRINYIAKGNKQCSKLMPYFNSEGILIKQVSVFKTDLQNWIKRCDSGFIFKSNMNRQWSYAAALKFFKKTCSECGFSDKGYTPHSTRHSFVSHKLADGVPLQTVSKLADHTTTFVTSSIYSHCEESDSIIGMAGGLV